VDIVASILSQQNYHFHCKLHTKCMLAHFSLVNMLRILPPHCTATKHSQQPGQCTSRKIYQFSAVATWYINT